MKNLLKALLSATLLISLFVACNKNEKKYSCNDQINEKVIKNMRTNQNISRYELAHLADLDYQMGVFLSLTPENKVRIFREKIAAEQTSEHLNSGEKAILNDLINFLKPAHYEDLNSEFNQFANVKESILRTNFAWDDAKVFIFTNSWMLETEILNYIAAKAMPGGGVGSGGGNPSAGNPCTCYYSYYCWIKGGGNGICESSYCNKSNGGCGVFGTTNCNGICK